METCNTGIAQICIDSIHHHIIIYYINGNIYDTGIEAHCENNNCCSNIGPNSYLNRVAYTSNNEFVFTYNDGNICRLQEVCKYQNIRVSDKIPNCKCIKEKCKCIKFKCGDIIIYTPNGDVYQYFGYTWDIIGNILGPTGPSILGPTGPPGPPGILANGTIVS